MQALLDDPDLLRAPAADDEAPIAERAGALVDWCRGFLGGLGLSGSLAHEGLTGDAGEVLADLGRIAATELRHGEAEDDEEAYAEVVEYVRVGVLLVHGELARAPHDATGIDSTPLGRDRGLSRAERAPTSRPL